MNFDRECGYYDDWPDQEDTLIACCPDCQSLCIDLVAGDHGYMCGECNATFIVP